MKPIKRLLTAVTLLATLALAGPAAAEGASLNAKYVEGVMLFTKAKSGLMAEATGGGQKFSFEPLKP